MARWIRRRGYAENVIIWEHQYKGTIRLLDLSISYLKQSARNEPLNKRHLKYFNQGKYVIVSINDKEKYFKTKEEAIKYAKAYMKNHGGK